jgi:putative ABC transport system permease protein
MALGARQGQVLGMVLREGANITGGALVLGALTAYWCSRFLVGLLFEVEPTDAATYLGVAALLAAVALVASYIPAHRATRVDPMRALKAD